MQERNYWQVKKDKYVPNYLSVTMIPNKLIKIYNLNMLFQNKKVIHSLYNAIHVNAVSILKQHKEVQYNFMNILNTLPK